MPYFRPTEPPAPERLAIQFESAILSLIRRFCDHPYVFYTETDMHCYLYHRLYSGGLANGLYRTKEGRDTILLHKEYPTVARYSRSQDGRLSESKTGRRRGAYDICIWDPRYIEEREHRKQKVLCAAELALNECGPTSMHTINDATKLAGPSNEIQYGYLLYFVRDCPAYHVNLERITRDLDDARTRVRVALVVAEEGKKTSVKLWDGARAV